MVERPKPGDEKSTLGTAGRHSGLVLLKSNRYRIGFILAMFSSDSLSVSFSAFSNAGSLEPMLAPLRAAGTRAAEAAQLFGLHRSSVSRLISQAHAGKDNVVELLGHWSLNFYYG
jgi:hypothetical protein